LKPSTPTEEGKQMEFQDLRVRFFDFSFRIPHKKSSKEFVKLVDWLAKGRYSWHVKEWLRLQILLKLVC
jgi:hypothetical protein